MAGDWGRFVVPGVSESARVSDVQERSDSIATRDRVLDALFSVISQLILR
jgi:hypothetical protein